jgi:formylglycine-generating enzyme required for sulfatase activity
MKIKSVFSAAILAAVFCISSNVLAACPSADLTGDCKVTLADFALFAAQWLEEGSYTLHINSSGAFGVSISSSTGHNGTTDYTQTLTAGTGVTLTAPAAVSDTTFTGWTGDVNSSNQTISFAMDADKTVTANYVDMVSIPGGSFQMGDSFDEGYSNELPVHTVTVDAFSMGKYEVTNQRYCAYLNSVYPSQITVTSGVVYQSGSGTSYPYCDTSTSSSDSQIAFSSNTFTVRTKNGRSMVNDPMVLVSWYGAVAYCNWRSQQEGKELCYNLSTWACDFSKNGYHLPTEAQWEYAARGGQSGKRFPWGDTINQTQANFYSAADSYDVSPVKNQFHPIWNDGSVPFTSPVGFFDGTLKYKTDYNWPGSATSYQTENGDNGYGLYDMAGNVEEWCNDWYGSDYYSSSPPSIPTGPATGTGRMLRGGGWYDVADYCRVADRGSYGPAIRDYRLGFRVSLYLSIPSTADIVWVPINDPGIYGHESFNGQMSKYETTNAQYCQFLNAAKASTQIMVYTDNKVYATSDTSLSQPYFQTFAASSYSQITYSGGTFSVRSRDGYSMANHPVVMVSWYGATAFCNYYGYRLPTEWEWQAVADYDGSYTYGCGTTISKSKANYYATGYAYPLGLTSYPFTTPVGYYSAYGYGMCDMAGNAFEWTSTVSGSARVIRGGSWNDYGNYCTVSSWYDGYPNYADGRLGFRVCR